MSISDPQEHRTLSHLFDANRRWATGIAGQDPSFFADLAAIQTPEYLWIGCSDSRVPANQITGLKPGEVFVHRNVANLVVHSDLNCLSVMQFAVDVLKVKHIMVVGHYGCGGVKAALLGERHGLVDNWLGHVAEVRHMHDAALGRLASTEQRWDRLCELNVVEQVLHVCRTSVVRDAWARGAPLTVHGWLYGLKDGLLQDMGMSPTAWEEVFPMYHAAVARLTGASG